MNFQTFLSTAGNKSCNYDTFKSMEFGFSKFLMSLEVFRGRPSHFCTVLRLFQMLNLDICRLENTAFYK